MGIIRLTLLTLVALCGAMMYFGRDEGLPEDRIGRAPNPEPVVSVSQAQAPEATPETPPVVADTPAAPAPDPTPAPEPEPTPAPEPAPEPEPEPEPAAEPPAQMLYVTARRVNVRSGPSTVYEAITSLPRDAAVVDLGDAGEGWRMIRLETGETGYMSGDFLSADAP